MSVTKDPSTHSALSPSLSTSLSLSLSLLLSRHDDLLDLEGGGRHVVTDANGDGVHARRNLPLAVLVRVAEGAVGELHGNL
eukprot:CAMPEP_0119495986 /NCGR_PEP_ID=MMETSP1344-20130328/19460_1 /TAXON_ID=236787 /ORGANISM="Florenciella parvula, Strain CCMP2471" /LENGTH=80 /DNA_ID=CAMNT_0007531629 /DNA_START=30 /DNA_END=269 /DNA_ORIENTATION=+